MGHAFNEFIVSTIRQAIPVVTAVMGAFYGAQRAGGSRRQFTNIAAFAGLGWLGGYMLRSTLLFLIEGGSKALPATTAQQLPPPLVPEEPASTSVAISPMQGMPQGVDPYSFSPTAAQGQVSTVDQSGAVPPKATNDGVSFGPAKQVAPRVNKRNTTLTTSAYGNVYGN